MFIDKPYRMALLLCIMTVIFRSLALHYKEPEIANFDVSNAICYTILAILLYLLTSRTKADEHRLRWEIAKQRDTDELTKLLTKNAVERKIKRYMEVLGLHCIQNMRLHMKNCLKKQMKHCMLQKNGEKTAIHSI